MVCEQRLDTFQGPDRNCVIEGGDGVLSTGRGLVLRYLSLTFLLRQYMLERRSTALLARHLMEFKVSAAIGIN